MWKKRRRTLKNLLLKNEWTNRYRKSAASFPGFSGGVEPFLLMCWLMHRTNPRFQSWGLKLKKRTMQRYVGNQQTRFLDGQGRGCDFLSYVLFSLMGKIEAGISFSPCPVGKDHDRSSALLELVNALENVSSSFSPSLHTLCSLLLKRMRFFLL